MMNSKFWTLIGVMALAGPVLFILLRDERKPVAPIDNAPAQTRSVNLDEKGTVFADMPDTIVVKDGYGRYMTLPRPQYDSKGRQSVGLADDVIEKIREACK